MPLEKLTAFLPSPLGGQTLLQGERGRLPQVGPIIATEHATHFTRASSKKWGLLGPPVLQMRLLKLRVVK